MKRGQTTGAEPVVLKLRQIAVQTAQGKNLSLTCKAAEISEPSCERRRREYGGPQIDRARRMQDLERENPRLSPSRIPPSGYPWSPPCNSLSISPVQDTGPVNVEGRVWVW